MSIETGDKISRIYGGFRGVDFRGDEINLTRSPDSLNVWKDYKETDSIRTRPGMELNTAFDDTVYGIYFFKGAMLVHSGKTLYELKNGEKKHCLQTATSLKVTPLSMIRYGISRTVFIICSMTAKLSKK